VGVSFEKLQIGHEYERPYLASLWGYKSFHAISRGVVTPIGTNYIILFVTKEKQDALTQYNDYLDGDFLHWEGEEKHSSDLRIINASKANDDIHLFYRDVHHSSFVYYGKLTLIKHQVLTDQPSQFLFSVNIHEQSDLIDDLEIHRGEFSTLEKTEQESIVKSRIGQGIFRDRLIKLWGGCSVTGLSNLTLLMASHIKPWRDCSNQERLDPLNGLLLHPTLNHLFDSGLITFDDFGRVQLSKRLSESDIKTLHINQDWTLRKFPNGIISYLRYHRERIFS